MTKWILKIIFIHMKNVRGIDLNLLIIFDALLVERSVTGAGERVGLAQSSVSNALTRLRSFFDDELFVRTPNGMVPTPVASEAAVHVKAAILAAEAAFNVGKPFEPELATGTIVLLTNDFIEFTILPWIIQALAKQAPGLKLKTRPLIREEFERELDTGSADLAIAAPMNIPKRFHYIDLFEEPFDGIARRDHPILEGGVTLSDFFSAKHIAMSHSFGGSEAIDSFLMEKQISLDLVVTVSNLASVPPLVSTTDYIAVVPRRLALIADRDLPAARFSLPFPAPSVQARLIWGRGVDRSPMFRWLRNLIVETVTA
ncbi:MAG: LysR family transcriptional regulator [Pseudomonadota bacterium]